MFATLHMLWTMLQGKLFIIRFIFVINFNIISWMLLDFFKLLGYKHCSSVSERKVLENVALQLETFGLWEWAIYILLHIESKFERETSIQNVLIRNIELHDKESLDKQKFVIDDLGIPRYWIDVAKYYKSRRIHNSWFEFKFLLRANKNVLALQTFYSHMAPHAIINGMKYIFFPFNK